MQVAFQTIAGVEGGCGVLNYFLQVIGVDGGHLIAVGVVLTVGLVEVDLGQKGSTGSLCRSSLFSLGYGQYGIGILQIVDNLLPAFVVGIFSVREVIVVLFCHVELVDERNLLEQALQLEMTIGTQELHLSGTLLDSAVVLVGNIQHVE